MRGGPLLKLLPVVTVLGAVSAYAAPTGPSQFDGKWVVRAMSEVSACVNPMFQIPLPLAVLNGEVHDLGIFGASARGKVDAGGALTVSISAFSDVVEAKGALKGDRGEGKWTSPTLSCSGEWVAERI
jgi:hypothetical protein